MNNIITNICLQLTNYSILDFRYYEDPSDQFRDREGTLLPLWTMTYERADNLYVTDISWSPDYFDMFAVTLGTCEYRKIFGVKT